MKRLPRGPFGLIAMDPPWSYLTYSGATVPHRRKGGAPYEVMGLDQIKALPVPSVAAKDCCLAMWILGSHIDQGFALAAHWGFRYTTDLFTWDKGRMGFGKWSRKEAEHCFLFKRGDPSPKPGSRGVRQMIRAPRREHSRKPAEFLERCEVLFHGPYLEMFSREDRPGWVSWGRDVGQFNGR